MHPIFYTLNFSFRARLVFLQESCKLNLKNCDSPWMRRKDAQSVGCGMVPSNFSMICSPSSYHTGRKIPLTGLKSPASLGRPAFLSHFSFSKFPKQRLNSEFTNPSRFDCVQCQKEASQFFFALGRVCNIKAIRNWKKCKCLKMSVLKSNMFIFISSA